MKIIKSILTVAVTMLASTAVHAQELKNESPKPPASKGPVIEVPAENKIPAPALVTDKEIPQTASKQNSAVEPVPVKGKEVTQPAVPVKPVLPPSTSLVPPNPVKYR
ncbi:MAG TPA: hypothetical protein VHL77_12700 [Ferruginibacter sp.]|jgi:hypothetical protein|nr:hypothetical protein [Ferruginibacter sp.]